MKKLKREGGLRIKGYLKNSTINKPLITIVTVVYNGQEHLEKTIFSVINQTYDNIEYIIIDGGSSDNTIDIIQRHENRIDYWISEKDEGIYSAMNKASGLANGKWINFMNCGDTFCNDKVISNIKFSDYSKYVMIYGKANIFNENRKFIKLLKPLNMTKKNLVIFTTRVVCHQAVFYNKKISFQFPNEYKLKGELFSYFEYLKFGPSFKLNLEICNYFLGGIGSIQRKNDQIETWQVLRYHMNLMRYLYLPMYLLKKMRLMLKI